MQRFIGARRRWLLLPVLTATAFAVACGSASDGPASDDGDSTAVPAASSPSPSSSAAPQLTAQERETLSRLNSEFPNLDTTKRTVPVSEVVFVLSRDSIPAIDAPQFDDIATADGWLQPEEPVVVLEQRGEVRAYPLQILTWHEVVNDVVGGEPVAVTYCPLCNTAIAFRSTVGGEPRTFGVSGKLRNSDLIMYDRQSETLWQQITGEGIIGTEAGTRLELLPSQITSYGELREAFPAALVLNRDTGHRRSYGENPYPFYDSSDRIFFAVEGADTERLDAKERVLTVEVEGDAIAFPFSVLSEGIVMHAEAGGQEVVAFWQPGAVSPLDSAFIIGSRNVGSAAAFVPALDGEPLSFEARDGAIVDVRTGSIWNVLGQAVSGPLEGQRLEQVVSANHFWFAWSVFQPETRVILTTS